jgi:hypothetical protein
MNKMILFLVTFNDKSIFKTYARNRDHLRRILIANLLDKKRFKSIKIISE